MFSEKELKNHLEELNQIRMYIDRLELETRIIKKSDIMPIHVLLAGLTVDYKERDRYVNFSFVPLSEDDLQFINLLQFYTTLPVEVKEQYIDDIHTLLHVINTHMAIGHFGIQEDGEVYIRYIYTTHRIHGVNEQQFLETLMLYTSMIDIHEEIIEKVGIGEMKLSDAIATFSKR